MVSACKIKGQAQGKDLKNADYFAKWIYISPITCTWTGNVSSKMFFLKKVLDFCHVCNCDLHGPALQQDVWCLGLNRLFLDLFFHLFMPIQGKCTSQGKGEITPNRPYQTNSWWNMCMFEIHAEVINHVRHVSVLDCFKNVSEVFQFNRIANDCISLFKQLY